MADYKAQITLNEKDSITDLLTLEKTMVKVYATALTEGVSNGFRETIEKHFLETVKAQFEVFSCLTECGYMRVTAAQQEEKDAIKEQFKKAKSQLKE